MVTLQVRHCDSWSIAVVAAARCSRSNGRDRDPLVCGGRDDDDGAAAAAAADGGGADGGGYGYGNGDGNGDGGGDKRDACL